MNIKKILRFCLLLFVVFITAYCLNFIWETYHATFLFKDHNVPSPEYVIMMTYVSVMDSFIVSGIFILTTILFRYVSYFEKHWRNFFTIFICGLVYGYFNELLNIYYLQRWVYNQDMPIILGVGLSPLLQLPITAVLSIFVAKRIIGDSYQRNPETNNNE